MKFIMRIDDVGYSRVHNVGSFRAIDEGIATSADIMLDCEGTVEALELLRARPWISTGWHTHFWGAPVLPVGQVPSLVETVKGKVRFKSTLARDEDIVYSEIYEEARAQIERCIRILGRTPDVGSGRDQGTPFNRALYEVCGEYGIPTDYSKRGRLEPETEFSKLIGLDTHEPAIGPIQMVNPESVLGMNSWRKRETMTVREAVSYEPLRYFLEDPCHILDYEEDDVIMTALHPGNVDEIVMDHGSNINYYLCRPIDTVCLCSQELHDWIKNNGVELCNLRDGLYGTREYQNHLRLTGSDLYRG